MAESSNITWQIINQAWTKAEALDGELKSRLDAAETTVMGGSSMTGANAAPIVTIAEPNVAIPLEAEGPDLTVFQQYNDAIIGKLTGLFGDYLSTYFPLSNTTLSVAETWVQNQISTGGAGINAAVEALIWERDRSRIAAELVRATDEIASVWASRRFPIPPGALQHQTLEIQKKSMDELAKSSREVAIETFKAELEMVRFAVSGAIQLRTLAVSAAGDYIRALASSQTTAHQMSLGKSQAQNSLIQAAASFYNARANAEDTMFKSRLANAGFIQEAAKVNVTLSSGDRHKRADVAVSAADAVGRQAAAMLNNLHTSVGVQGEEKL